MVASVHSTPPRNVRETISWLLRLGRPPLPECPIEAAKEGREPKQPCFLDSKGYLKSVSWKQWQNTQPIKDIIDSWFCNPQTGIGTLGGWNGKHWLGWIDFDQKDFASPDECDRIIEEWQQQYPLAQEAPMFRTPSGGYRFLVAFDTEPEKFKANSGFSLKADGSYHVGELLTKNGAHTLLPPTVGVTGKPYYWVRWSEYPPVVTSPEQIGIYPVQKKTKAQKTQPTEQATRTSATDSQLGDFLDQEIYPRLSLEQSFNWHGHDFQASGDKLKGNCPWHDSQSGTAFYCEKKGNTPVWRCPACDLGGGVLEYRHRLRGGSGALRGKEFVEAVKELADEVGVEMPASNRPASSSKQVTGNVVAHPALTQQASVGVIKNEIEELLLSKQLSDSEVEAAKIDLRRRHPSILAPELDKLWNAIACDLQKTDAKTDDREELEKLLKLGDQSLKLADYLPPTLANPLSLYCEWLNVKPETVLLALLTATSSLHEVGTELVIHRTQGFSVPPTIFSAMVAESGQKKSPITKQIVSKPLAILKKEALESYAADYEDYQLELQDWEQRKSETPKGTKFTEPAPKEPTPAPIFYFTEATGEGIKAQAQNAPTKTLFALVDELAGFFNSSDKYRGGRGSDKQDLLSYYDGTGQTVLRSSGVKVDVPQIYLSIFGTIQPEVIRSVMRGSQDPDGQWARFLYVQQPLAASFLRDDDGSAVDIVDLLAGVYRKLHNTPARQYTLSREAFKVYQPYYNRLEQMRVTHPNPGMRAVYSKAEGYTGRLALNLHVLHELSTGRSTPSTEIPVERMREALALMNFFIGQTRLLYSTFDEGTAPHIVKMMELSRRLRLAGQEGWVKAKDIQSGYNSKSRPKPDIVRGWMQEAVNLGLGEVRGVPTRLEFRVFGDSNKKVDSVDSSGLKVDLKWTQVEKLETLANNTLGDLNNKKVDLVDSTPHPQDATTFAKSDLVTPQEVVDFSGQGEIVSPLKTQNEDTEPKSAVDSESNISPLESTFGQIESTFLSTSPINAVDADGNEVPPVESKSTNDEVEEPTITQGSRVQVIMPGSIRNDCIGTVRSIRENLVRVYLDDSALGQLRWFECYLPFTDLRRLKIVQP
ncbi:DUF3987 domain-containing protein [Tolypothrix campylonemoides VB511288]|nr:DUF3987 domain-containing protein [Tolypothrix campylonemoides VB511288]